MRFLVLVGFLITSFVANAVGVIVLSDSVQKSPLISTNQVEYVNDSTQATFAEVLRGDLPFQVVNEVSKKNFSANQWLRLRVKNASSTLVEYKMSVAFTDKVTVYYSDHHGVYQANVSGDMLPLSQRAVHNGKMVFFNIPLHANQLSQIYIHLQSTTPISVSCKDLALKSIFIYSPTYYDKIFEHDRIFQALFYGAILIMLFYNLFIYFTLKSKAYLYYVLYLMFLVLFLSSNSGYLFELMLPNHPRQDLYLRFLTVPLLMVFYVLFSRKYLKTEKYNERYYILSNWIILFFVFTSGLMVLGFWRIGRDLNIIGSVLSFMFILVMSISSYRKGFTPARYFIGANIFLILGGIVYASQRILEVSQNPFSQYSIQISVVLQVSLFSFGLADTINVIRKQLTEKKLESERLKVERELEKKRIIEEKNRELEGKVVERTQMVVKQKEEILSQNKLITDSIKYALNIQKAILGDINGLKNTLGIEGFIFFSPKHIVSGDFYWFTNAKDAAGSDIKIIIAADCTGHGVPGAFMTVLGNTLLNQIVKNEGITRPDIILTELDDRLKTVLAKDQVLGVNDGMDISIVTINGNKIQYAGANNPLCYVHEGKLTRVKATPLAVGGEGQAKEFILHRLTLQKGDVVYLFTDGFQDQFDKEDRQKYMSVRFRKYLEEISVLPIHEQSTALMDELQSWKGEVEQTDDVLVVGFIV